MAVSSIAFTLAPLALQCFFFPHKNPPASLICFGSRHGLVMASPKPVCAVFKPSPSLSCRPSEDRGFPPPPSQVCLGTCLAMGQACYGLAPDKARAFCAGTPTDAPCLGTPAAPGGAPHRSQPPPLIEVRRRYMRRVGMKAPPASGAAVCGKPACLSIWRWVGVPRAVITSGRLLLSLPGSGL